MGDKLNQSAKDKIRAATVGSKRQFRSEVAIVNGVEIELRQPSIRVRKEIVALSKNEDGQVEMLEFLQRALIECAYVPGTDERIFDETDYDTINEHPTGGWVDKLTDKLLVLVNIRADEIAKNSEGTASDNFSSE
jgi:hypothetical protein